MRSDMLSTKWAEFLSVHVRFEAAVFCITLKSTSYVREAGTLVDDLRSDDQIRSKPVEELLPQARFHQCLGTADCLRDWVPDC